MTDLLQRANELAARLSSPNSPITAGHAHIARAVVFAALLIVERLPSSADAPRHAGPEAEA